MGTKEEIQWKLIRLKQAIGESSNVKSEIKGLLEKVTIDNVGPEVDRPSRDEIFKIYQARYRFLESRGEHNESFANLLKRLEETDNSLHLVITGLRTEGNLYLVFTDKDYHKCFGIIY